MHHSDEKIIAKAMKILARNLRQPGHTLSSPDTVKKYLTLSLAREEREIFGVLWLDVKNRVIKIEHLFFGSIASASVYPREVIKSALKHNASAALCFHCHPSGNPDPSDADKIITIHLKKALDNVEVRLFDHIIIGGMESYSFAENGLI